MTRTPLNFRDPKGHQTSFSPRLARLSTSEVSILVPLPSEWTSALPWLIFYWHEWCIEDVMIFSSFIPSPDINLTYFGL